MDILIPGGMGGEEAVGEIHRINPDAKVIASSGLSDDPIMTSYGEYGFCAVIDKPYRLDELREVIDQVI